MAGEKNLTPGAHNPASRHTSSIMPIILCNVFFFTLNVFMSSTPK
jgi:hypothetical protein